MHLRYHYDLSPSGTLQELSELGITYRFRVLQTMGDQVWLFCCENVPAELPPYLSAIKQKPRELLGWGLTQEKVREIENWEANRDAM